MPSLPNLSPPGNRKYRWYGLIKEGQEDFSGGAFFGQERVPANGCEDIINGFVDQDGGIARRGGSLFRGATIGSTPGTQFPRWLWDGYLAAGRRTIQARTLTSGGVVSGSLYLLNDTETAWVQKGTVANACRPVALGGVLWYVSGSSLNVIGGDLAPPSGTPTGTITVTQGSTKITGSGTNFTSIFTPGNMLYISDAVSGDRDNSRVLAVQAVTNDTTLTLALPYSGGDLSGLAAGSQWTAIDARSRDLADPAYPNSNPFLGTTGTTMVMSTAADRLLFGYGTRVAFSSAGDASIFSSTNYHELPSGAIVVGLEGIRDSCLVFTTRGVWAIRNLAYDLTDAQGNVQQQLQPVYPDLVLWGEMGIAQYLGSAVVPMTDGVYLLDGTNSPVGLGNEAILSLYRGYVAAGYTPGQATVYQSKYVLPILNNNTWVDTLVCDLRSRAWSRWDGHGGQINRFATRVGDTSRQPLLLGAANGNTSLVEMTNAFAPSTAVKNDADGSTHQLKVTFRTLTAGTIPVQWRKFRVRFEADDAGTDDPQLQCELATGRPGNTFTTLSGLGAEGETTFNWQTSKKARAIRYRVTSLHAASRFVIRSFESFYRYTGRT